MVGLWCATGWASATKMHAFDRDVCLAVGVWWCGVASQPMAGHPWSLLMAIWIHTATWRRLLDRTCCPWSVVREGTWPFSRTMPDYTHVSSWIFSDMRMCCWLLGPGCPRFVANRARVGRNGQTVETTTKPAHHAITTWRSPARSLARYPTSIPCQPSGINEASVSGMCQCARWSHTLLTVWTVVWPPLCCDVIKITSLMLNHFRLHGHNPKLSMNVVTKNCRVRLRMRKWQLHFACTVFFRQHIFTRLKER